MYANEVMSPQVATCTSDSNLEYVSRLMWENDCGAIPVVDDENKAIGIVTDRDIAMAAMLNHKSLWELKAGALIENQILCCAHQDSSIEDCLELMEKYEVRRLPIINEDGVIAGVLSMGDAIAFASKRITRSKQAKTVSFDNVMGMLKHVSAHHKVVNHPVSIAS